ncbi:MGMT family protein [Georgenia sp. TF02-10]|uniref:MGMT family protein n=1 Tax=Georgenia sp. TF02-10 TaxID=2917725 RepID=UPI001FA6D62B|nr:MGMT family protein [Georgenia sp. TF02-10]UNX55849.1 MGMT family protein [Georgenia sp. TF02-10]
MLPARTELTELVLDVADQVPPGRATTYGLVAAAVRDLTGHGHARHVGSVMAAYGAEVPWWRVVRADGTLPRQLRDRALRHYQEEGTVLSLLSPVRVDLSRSGWDAPRLWRAPALAAPAVAAAPDLPGTPALDVPHA